MFWRKKKSDEVLFELDSNDRRKAVRLKPMSPLYLESADNRYAVIDISALGVAFESTEFALNDQLLVSLKVPDKDEKAYVEIQCELKIINIVERICHCVFFPMDVYNQMHLDQYILNEQKRQIRRDTQYRAINNEDG